MPWVAQTVLWSLVCLGAVSVEQEARGHRDRALGWRPRERAGICSEWKGAVMGVGQRNVFLA